jgi:predicted outer membrane repeat protein
MVCRVLMVIVLGLFCGATNGADVHVPGDYATIQAAVNAAADGDQILIAPGTYTERIAWTGKGLSLIGTNGAGSTIIDARGAPGTGPAIDVVLSSGQAFLAQGLTVRGDESRFSEGITFFGGAGMLLSGGDLTIRECVIEDCSINNWPSFGLRWGGGVLVYGISTTRVIDSAFRNNEGESGGALAMRGTAEVRGCVFENNSATIEGGAVLLPQNVLALEGCAFRNNTAGTAGAVRFVSGTNTVVGCVFAGNSATGVDVLSGRGGAISGPVSSLLQCVFAGNTASDAGGAVSASIATLDLESCLFLDNVAPSGAAASSSQTLVATNSIFWNNGTGDPLSADTEVVEYCVVQAPTPGAGNIIADPMIVDPVSEDWSLAPGSPAIDAGSNLLVRLDADDLDGDGLINDRYPFDLLGNHRFTQDLAVADTGETEGLLAPVDIGPVERAFPVITDGNDDCNGNFVNDLIDILTGTETDLNSNLIPDSCDIADGTLTDENENGIPDEFEDPCFADLTGDGALDFFDLSAYLNLYQMGCPE